MRLPLWSACALDESRRAELAYEHEVAEGPLSSLANFPVFLPRRAPERRAH